MTAEKLYYTLSLLVNKNNEDSNINIEKENFVLLYNREIERWLSDYIKDNGDTDLIDNIEELMVKGHTLEEISSDAKKSIYKLPENYFSVINGSSTSQTGCGVIYNWVFKPNDENVALEDKMTRPSTVWERGVAIIGGGNFTVYKDGFNIDSTTLSYYRKPKEIDLAGYVDLENNPSLNIDPDTSDYISNLILDRVAIEIKREFSDSADFQLAQTRQRGY